MIFFIHRIQGDVSGHYDECFIVDSHHEFITQDILDDYNISLISTSIESINNSRWICLSSNSDFIIIVNDKVDTEEYSKELENVIRDYKCNIRDEKISKLLE